jgi:hypothetical protein
MAQAPGRWLADAKTLERLGMEAGGPVAGADFIALMDGRSPDVVLTCGTLRQTEYQSSTTCLPKPTDLQAFPPMEPTGLNANHCARIEAGKLAL